MSVINQWPVSLPLYTVATLPLLDASQAGALAYATDAIGEFSGTVSRVLVTWSGTIWAYTNTGLQVRTNKSLWLLDIARLNPKSIYDYNFITDFDDFAISSPNVVFQPYASVIFGAGSTSQEIATIAATEAGVLDLNAGTVATGRAHLSKMLVSWSPTRLAYFGCKCRATNPSTITDRFTIRIGFGDNNVGAENVDGVFFRYVDNVNSNFLQCVNRSNNIETVSNLTTTMPQIFTKFEIVLNGDGTSTFYINGVAVVTNLAGAPNTIGRELGINTGIFKSIGVLARSLYVDYMSTVFEIGAR
jgi:hypothetical protein